MIGGDKNDEAESENHDMNTGEDLDPRQYGDDLEEFKPEPEQQETG